MKIQVNTDSNIQGRESLIAEAEATMESSLKHFQSQITRIEVHLSDENSRQKGGGNDKRCLLEARIEGRQPVAVTHISDSLSQAMAGAAQKIKASLSSTLGKQNSY